MTLDVKAHGIRKRHGAEWLGRSLHAYFALEVDGSLVFTSESNIDNSTDWKFPALYKL